MTYTRWFAGLVLIALIAACGDNAAGPMPSPSLPITQWELVAASVDVADVVYVDDNDDYVVAQRYERGLGFVYEGALDRLQRVEQLGQSDNMLDARLWTDGESVFASTQDGPYFSLLSERRAGVWEQRWKELHYSVYPFAANTDGTRDDLYLGGPDLLVHFDGTAAHVTQVTAGAIEIIPAWKSAGQSLWGLGRTLDQQMQGIYRWNEPTWELASAFPEGELIDGLWGDDSGLHWAVGTGLYQRLGDNWSRTHETLVLHAIAGDSIDDLYAVGDAGTLLHFDGDAWSMITVPTETDLLRVSISPTQVLIVTADGKVLRGLRQ